MSTLPEETLCHHSGIEAGCVSCWSRYAHHLIERLDKAEAVKLDLLLSGKIGEKSRREINAVE